MTAALKVTGRRAGRCQAPPLRRVVSPAVMLSSTDRQDSGEDHRQGRRFASLPTSLATQGSAVVTDVEDILRLPPTPSSASPNAWTPRVARARFRRSKPHLLPHTANARATPIKSRRQSWKQYGDPLTASFTNRGQLHGPLVLMKDGAPSKYARQQRRLSAFR